MVSLEGGYTSEEPKKKAFQRCVNLGAQKQRAGRAEGEHKPCIGPDVVTRAVGHGSPQ